MEDMENEELQSAGSWDIEKGFVQPGVPKGRAVVSVAFAREDFVMVAEAAQKAAMKTSEYIREAALARAKFQTKVTSFGWSVNSVGIVTNAPAAPGTSAFTKPEIASEELARTT